MPKVKKQFAALSIRLTEAEYKAVQEEAARLQAATGVEISLNAVLTGLIRSGLEARRDAINKGLPALVPAPYC